MARFSAFLNTLILLGALQGFIVSSLLHFSKKQRQSSRLMAALIFFISLACFNLYGANNNWFGSAILRFIADLLPLVIIMPLGPLLYFYVRSVADPSFKITKRQRRHFYPVIVDLVTTFTIIVFITGLIFRVFKNKPGPWGIFIDTYNVYADIPRWISVTLYVFMCARVLSTGMAKDALPAAQQPEHKKWLRQLVGGFAIFQCIWLVYLVPYIIPKYSDRLLQLVDWYPIYIPMTIIIYWLGIKGFIAAQQEVPVPPKKAALQASALSQADVKQAAAALVRCMQVDKLYLNPGLSLEVVAQHTFLPAKTISAVLNQHMNKSFNEFVNEYRVKAFIEKMQQPGMEALTIAGIAFDCGFNSQATFQRTFKLVMGMPPTEYRKTALAAH